jgi:hypothetical protein
MTHAHTLYKKKNCPQLLYLAVHIGFSNQIISFLTRYKHSTSRRSLQSPPICPGSFFLNLFFNKYGNKYVEYIHVYIGIITSTKYHFTKNLYQRSLSTYTELMVQLYLSVVLPLFFYSSCSQIIYLEVHILDQNVFLPEALNAYRTARSSLQSPPVCLVYFF